MELNKTAFRSVPRTGVINVMHQAYKKGYSAHHKEWANLGQGAPETGELSGAPQRIKKINIDEACQEYAPIPGRKDLRQAVADFYNHFYRKNKKSKYTYQNVCITSGGRTALTQLAVSLGNVNIGHFIPDYTAYEELLTNFRNFVPMPILLNPKHKYKLSLAKLKQEILGRGLSALLISNPCNPTGQLIEGAELKKWITLTCKFRCSFIFDEFYSHYIYTNSNEKGKMVSSAEYVEDVNKDPIIIVDGLTKNWRYPGWRIGWIVGPKEIVEAASSASSFVNGGANHPLQKQAISLMKPELILAETKAIQKNFRIKRDYMLKFLKKLKIKIEVDPQGTFYCWANLNSLPKSLRNGEDFFAACLKEKTIVVPGVFFDVNPNKRRIYSNYQNYVRLSFGPPLEELKRGLEAIKKVIKNS